MATAVIMPKQGQSVETCIITKWFRNIGESISVGDILFSYETDKASFDLESPVEGILLDIFFNDGAEVPILVNVAVIGKSGEETQSFNQGHSLLKVEAKAETDVKVETKADNRLQLSTDSKIRISPRAKRMAENKGLNYNNLQGSGPNGRIITCDIDNLYSGDAPIKTKIQVTGTAVSYTHLTLPTKRIV